MPLMVRYLYYLLYNTSLEYNSYTTFYSAFFLHSYVPRKLQFRTGFHLASSILLLLYLAAMWRLVSYFILSGSL